MARVNAFSQQLSASAYTEILSGGSYVMFDCDGQAIVEVLVTETGTTPDASTVGAKVQTWPHSWDFIAKNMTPGLSRVWAKGDNKIRGYRDA